MQNFLINSCENSQQVYSPGAIGFKTRESVSPGVSGYGLPGIPHHRKTIFRRYGTLKNSFKKLFQPLWKNSSDNLC
ncbi:hypothetical protein AYI70_g2723 [Smittium culicis]|uniref:Uncharacterized protein n=1 Tax=Smittium culicis TaxID=133412 RepID=A0A1R1Y6T7_9FUNG|nr:hypothetical protein AYI70_g2723 [Smittium culicis]